MLISLNFVILCDFIGLFELKTPNLEIPQFPLVITPDWWYVIFFYRLFILLILSSFTISRARKFLSFRNFRCRFPKISRGLSCTCSSHRHFSIFTSSIQPFHLQSLFHTFFRQIFFHLSVSFFFPPHRVLFLIGANRQTLLLCGRVQVFVNLWICSPSQRGLQQFYWKFRQEKWSMT